MKRIVFQLYALIFFCMLMGCFHQKQLTQQEMFQKPTRNTLQSETDDFKTIVVSGESEISCDAAILDAQQKAVMQAGETFIESHSLLNNSILIHNVLFSKTKGYISEYAHVNQGIDGACNKTGAFFLTTIRAKVKKKYIQDRINGLAILQKALGNPVIALMVEENSPKTLSDKYSHFAQTRAQKLLIDNGFSLVDNNHLQIANTKINKRFKSWHHPIFDVSFKIIARWHISTTDISKDIDSEYKLVTASFNGDIIQTQTGHHLGSFTSEKRKQSCYLETGMKNVLTRTIDNAVETKIVPILLDKWQHYFVNGVPVRLYIDGLRTNTDFLSIIRRLESLDEIKRIVDTSFYENRGTIDILYHSTIGELGKLFSHNQLFSELRVIEYEKHSLFLGVLDE